MQNTHATIVGGAFLSVIGYLVLTSCAGAPGIIRKWQEPGTTATMEFFRDGTFTAVDDMEMAVEGNYILQTNGRIQFDIKHQNASTESITGSLVVQKSELIVTIDGEKEPIRHERIQ